MSSTEPGSLRPPYRLVWSEPLSGPSRAEAWQPVLVERHGPTARSCSWRSRLLQGDNLRWMESLLPEFAGKIDLIYLDPPFNAGHPFRMPVTWRTSGGEEVTRDEVAYEDSWPEGAAGYLSMLAPRLELARDFLSPTGSLILHVNWRVSHLAQVLLDELFGPGERERSGRPGFRNEIVWGYGGGGALRTAYRRKHDVLLWYTRSERWTFNSQFRPYSEGTRQRGLTAVKGPRYRLRDEGASLESWWTDPAVQKILSPTAHENLKFPTQKPESLLERVLRGHSDPGDLVADFFCGSGTTGAVAQRLGRRWIMADASPLAVHVTRKRLLALQPAPGDAVALPLDAECPAEHPAGFDLYQTADAPRGHLSATVERDGTHLRIRLTEYQPAGEPPADLGLLDYWALEFRSGTDSPNEPITPDWHACPTRTEPSLPMEAIVTSPSDKPVELRLYAIDAFGRTSGGRVSLGT